MFYKVDLKVMLWLRKAVSSLFTHLTGTAKTDATCESQMYPTTGIYYPEFRSTFNPFGGCPPEILLVPCPPSPKTCPGGSLGTCGGRKRSSSLLFSPGLPTFGTELCFQYQIYRVSKCNREGTLTVRVVPYSVCEVAMSCGPFSLKFNLWLRRDGR